jgi:hypothetical protein
MAYTATVLAWGLVDNQAGYTAAGTYIPVTVTSAYCTAKSQRGHQVKHI